MFLKIVCTAKHEVNKVIILIIFPFLLLNMGTTDKTVMVALIFLYHKKYTESSKSWGQM